VSDSTTPVILSAVRTPIGRYLGGLSGFTAPQLGAMVIREAVARSGVDPAAIDDVIMGQVVQGGSGQAPARQARGSPPAFRRSRSTRCAAPASRP
jgi:acetyl-CoA C-acetyltransferase